MRRKTRNIALLTLFTIIIISFLLIDPINLFNFGDSDDETYVYGDFNIKFAVEGTTNDYARQKTQLNAGVYDKSSNSTFIVYSSGVNGVLSANSPCIIYFNHTTQEWSQEKEIETSPVEPDAHNYPSLIIDESGYLHVFHTFHANHDILYAKSKEPRDISEWTITYLEGTEKATYGAAYQAKNGDFYLLVRMRLEDYTDYDYEPEFMLKSTDHGGTWSITRLIDPGPVKDYWGTIYTKGIHYESQPEGLHITFGVHQHHNGYMNEHFYIFYSFEDNHIYGVNGQDYGGTLEQSEMVGNVLVFDLGGTVDFYNVRIALDLDDSGNPYIFWNEETTDKGDILRWATWDEGNWVISDAQEMEHIGPFGANYIGSGIFELYTKKWGSWAYYYQYDTRENNKTKTSLILHTNDNVERGFSQIMFIENAHPEILGFFIDGDGSNWQNPKPNGKLITFGLK